MLQKNQSFKTWWVETWSSRTNTIPKREARLSKPQSSRLQLFPCTFPKHVNPMPPSILEGNRISAPIDEGCISCRLWVERNTELATQPTNLGDFTDFSEKLDSLDHLLYHGPWVFFQKKRDFFLVEDPQKLAANSAAQLDDWLPVWRRWLLPASRLFRSVDMGSLAMGHRDTVGSQTGTNPIWKDMSIWNPQNFPQNCCTFSISFEISLGTLFT